MKQFLSRKEMMAIVCNALGKRLDCPAEQFSKEGIYLVENHIQTPPFLEVVSINSAVIVSASPDILPQVTAAAKGKTREELFEMPYVYGQSIYYLPDQKVMPLLDCPEGYTVKRLAGEEVDTLRGIQGFENSLAFDERGNTPTRIVSYLEKDGKIVGLAGASKEDGNLWEVGIDVCPQCRHGGIGTYLVTDLTFRILEQGNIPFYCAASSNIGSQAVAYCSGYRPSWVSTYRNIFDGSCSYENLVKRLR